MKWAWVRNGHNGWSGHARPCTRDFLFMGNDRNETEGVIWQGWGLQPGAVSTPIWRIMHESLSHLLVVIFGQSSITIIFIIRKKKIYLERMQILIMRERHEAWVSTDHHCKHWRYIKKNVDYKWARRARNIHDSLSHDLNLLPKTSDTKLIPHLNSQNANCNDRVFYDTLAFLVWKVLFCVMVEKSKRKVFGEHVSISDWWISFYCVGQIDELKFYAMLVLG